VIRLDESIRKKIDEIMREIEDRVSELTKQVEDLVDKGEVRRAYRLWRSESRRLIRDIERDLESIEDMLRGLNRDVAEEIMKEVRDRVDHVLDKMTDLAKRLGLRIERRKLKPVVIEFIPAVGEAISDIMENVMNVLEDVREELEDRLEEIAESFKTTQVVSVRIRGRDLEIIDQLVDAGIFKSRSEAIAFFTRKGIEASKQWIEKALEQAKKIKELQESIRRELEESEE